MVPFENCDFSGAEEIRTFLLATCNKGIAKLFCRAIVSMEHFNRDNNISASLNSSFCDASL